MEVEFKFHIPTAQVKAVETDLRRGPVKRMRMRARYFDTTEGALAAHQMVLRLRQEGARWVQTVKAVGSGGPLQRLEHNVELGLARVGQLPSPDPRRHAGTPVGARLAKVLVDAATPLAETYATDIWRLTRHVQQGNSTVELALDFGQVMARPQGGGKMRAAAVCELELELVAGDLQGLVVLAERWSQRHGLWVSTLSKAGQGERLRAGSSGLVAVKATPPFFSDDGRARADGPSIQRAVLAACLAQLLPNASELAANSNDGEQVHQLRVGIRRLRTALRELAPLGEGFNPAWNLVLVETFRALGVGRDREVLLQTVQPQLVEAGAPPVEWRTDDAQARSPGDVVRAVEFQRTLVGLIGFAQRVDGDDQANSVNKSMRINANSGQEEGAVNDDPTPLVAGKAARRYLRRRLQKLHAQLVQDGERFELLAPTERHQVRKRLKRLRYLAEFVAPLFDSRQAKRYLARLEPAQDALGHFNDEVVAAQAYQEVVAADPRAWFALGWLSARQNIAVKACRKALRKIGQARGFWEKP